VPTDATAVVLNLTAVAPTRTDSITAYPDGTTAPGASALDADAGRTNANLVVVPIGPDGSVDLLNHAGRVNLVADLAGYFTG
jgi:hypothetical protein